jgi:hypothetical protein
VLVDDLLVDDEQVEVVQDGPLALAGFAPFRERGGLGIGPGPVGESAPSRAFVTRVRLPIMLTCLSRREAASGSSLGDVFQ